MPTCVTTSRQASSASYQDGADMPSLGESWRVLASLAEVLENCRVAENRTLAPAQPALTSFVKPGSMQAPAQKMNTMRTPGKEWQMVVDSESSWSSPERS